MNKLTTLWVLLVMLVACSTPGPKITLTNSGTCDLNEKPVIIERSQFKEQTGSNTQLPFLKAQDTGNLIACQTDDTDGDGAWDELFTLVDLKAGETRIFNLVWIDKNKAPEVKIRTNIRFASQADQPQELTEAVRLESNTTEISQQYFQFEGPGWENDLVGFRNYFDARNGIDIWGKISHDMVLDRVGLKSEPSYHELQDWGMDILKVANSLGAGAIALQTPNGLYRVGPGCTGTYKLVTEGPLRSMFDLEFKGIDLEGTPTEVKHRICIIAGKPWYQSIVAVTSASAPKLVTGIVNLHSDSVYTISIEGFASMYTHDNQAFDGEKLGLALIVPQNTIEVYTAPEEGEGITQTFYTALDISPAPNVFYFMSGWEKQDPRWSDKEGFEAGIIEQGQQITSQLTVTVE